MHGAEPAARTLDGRLVLRFQEGDARTILATAERTPPWHVQRPLFLYRQHPRLATVTLLNTTAGLCAGDRLVLALDVGDGAVVEATSPTVTRTFSMSHGCAETRTSLRVAAGGYLEYLPRGVLLCGGAELRSSTSIAVEPGGAAGVGEVIVFGRAATGEGHAYRALSHRLELLQSGEVLLAEALDLAPDREPERAGVLGGYSAYGSLHLIAPSKEPAAMLAAVRSVLAAQTGTWSGASTLPRDAGVTVRVLARSGHAAWTAVRAAMDVFRGLHCADD
jgi:urease accessory protein